MYWVQHFLIFFVIPPYLVWLWGEYINSTDLVSNYDELTSIFRTKNSGAFQGVVVGLFLWHSIWSAPPLHHAAIGIGEDVVMSL